MIGVFFTAVVQLLLLLTVAPLVSGLIKTLKARLQIRRGPGILQPYRDLYKLFQKGMVMPGYGVVDLHAPRPTSCSPPLRSRA